MRARPNEAFAPTQPIEEHQRRLAKQKRWRRLGRYVPNQLPLGERFLYGILALTWSAWALIGLVTGHMFVLVSRRGPLHFSGLAALLFACAVLCSAALCVLQLVDHYDTRDNERHYRIVRRWLWRLVASLFLVALIAGCTESQLSSVLGHTFNGFVPARELRDLLTSKWVTDAMRPIAPSLGRWFALSGVWLLGCGLLLHFFGITKRGKPMPQPVAVGLVYIVLLPLLATFTLGLVGFIASGEAAATNVHAPERLITQLAWATTMLVACAGVWFMLILTTLALIMRAIGRPINVPPSSDAPEA